MPDRLTAADVAIIIPTRDRWPVMHRTLDSLAGQSVQGFERIVVVDGEDQRLPPLDADQVLVLRHGGPGAARNAGARATSRRLLLFLGDDMIATPGLVEAHLDMHRAHPGEQVAVLGHVSWHPEVAGHRLNAWLDRSRSQFDYDLLTGQAGQDVGFGRFFSCNVSLHRSLFTAVGGFDEAFTYYYEDLDCGWRLSQAGMMLLYQPAALAHHLHAYDWAAMARRFEGVAMGERLMAAKHAWFEPFFLRRIELARAGRRALPLWPVVERHPVAVRSPRMLAAAQRRIDTLYRRRLSRPFLRGWENAAEMCELRDYLGDEYQAWRLIHHHHEVDNESTSAPNEATFYRTSNAYLYDLTVFAMSGTKDPYRRLLARHLGHGAQLLDYGCGIGSDGLRFIADGYRVSFADFDNPSLAYLRWRLARRRLRADVYDIEHDTVPDGFDAAYAFDVIEHVDDPFAFLERLEESARVVAVNFLEPDPNETHLHRALPIQSLLDHAQSRGLLSYRRYHGRSHMVVYRAGGAASATTRARSRLALATGRLTAAATRRR
jgi:2-polyprenyl-3-methyl-5-hydroxy-6-metoxy-1,4-benzoquinol methylase